MIQNRLIPILLLKGDGLVKTQKFRKPKYVGDPLNAIKIFNDKEVDELVFLDIMASKEKRGPNFELLKKISTECFMPLGYGGGITNMADIEQIFNIGFEKVILNTSALNNTGLITEVAKASGIQSVVGSIDYKKSFFKGIRVYDHAKGKTTNKDVLEHAKTLVDAGVGEIIINCVDRDGTMVGYDVEFVTSFAAKISVPVVVAGGAGSLTHVRELLESKQVSAAAAGSMFVFHGPHKAVLINYPNQEKIKFIYE